ncbi:MAG TPA: MFS transporter [Jatrophihabitans sp.]|nr:MFS transporter [Jatrophihabitans sp.]
MSFRSLGRDVALVVIARSVSWFGDAVATVALMLRLQSQGHGATAVAALLIANALPIVALSGIVGRLVDRYDNRTLVVLSSLAQGAVCLTVAAVDSTPAVLGLVGLLGAGQAVNAASWQALLAAMTEGDGLTRALGHATAGRTLAGIAAPAVSGLLVGLYGAGVPLLIDAGAYLAVTGVALLIATRRTVGPAGDGAPVRGGLSIVRADDLLRPLFVMLGLFVLLGSMVNVVEVFLVRETLGASTTWYGLAGATLSAGSVVGALLAGRLRGVRALARGLVWSAIALAASLAIMGGVPSVAWVLPVGALLGAANGILNVALSSLVMGRARAAERGRVSALLSGIASGTQILAFAAGGALAAAFTPREIFVAAGALGIMVPVLLGRGLIRAASVRADPSPAAAPYALFSRRSRLGVSRGTRVG